MILKGRLRFMMLIAFAMLFLIGCSNSKILEERGFSKDTGKTCRAGAGFECSGFKVTADGISVDIKNDFSHDVVDLTLLAGNCGSSSHPEILKPKEKKTFAIACGRQIPYDDLSYSGQFNISYTNTMSALRHNAIGAINIEKFAAETIKECRFDENITCIDHKITPNGITLVIRNLLGYPSVDVINIIAEKCGTSNEKINLKNRAVSTFLIPCREQLAGKEYSGELTILYSNPEDGSVYTQKGFLKSSIE